VRGYIRSGEVGLLGPYILRDLRYDPSADSLHFWYTEGGRGKDVVSVRLTCSGLRGTSVSIVFQIHQTTSPGPTRSR